MRSLRIKGTQASVIAISRMLKRGVMDGDQASQALHGEIHRTKRTTNKSQPSPHATALIGPPTLLPDATEGNGKKSLWTPFFKK